MKKLLSIVLITAMILSLIPSVFANTEASDLVLAYNFDFGAAGYAGVDSFDLISNADAANPVYAESNTAPWFLDSWTNVYKSNFVLTGNSVTGNQKPNSLYWYVVKNHATATSTAIRIKIDEAGVYYPKLSYYPCNVSITYNVYLVPFGIASDLQNGYLLGSDTTTNGNSKLHNNYIPQVAETNGIFLGTIDLSTGTAGTVTTYDFGGKSIEVPSATADEYELILTTKNTNQVATSAHAQINIDSFSLYSKKAVEADVADEFTPETAGTVSEPTVARLAYLGKDENGAPITQALGDNEATQTITYEDKTYNFRYWTKGLTTGVSANRQALSTALNFNYKPYGEGVNYLIAVYEEAGAAADVAFYDRNGQLLTGLDITDNALPTELPATAGYGEATGWEQLGTGDVFDAGEDVSELEGAKVFMAVYGDPVDNIVINDATYAYGDTVTCKDIVDSYDSAMFSYWARTIDGKKEIVSIDENYSFSAFTDCTIEAVCEGPANIAKEAARKIVLSTFSVTENLTAVMAEFIGFDSATEKGIMFGGRAIAMTTNKAQFTVINDTTSEVTVTGYAVLGGVKYTDGSIDVAAAK